MEFRLFRKLPVEVYAADIDEKIEVETREGILHGYPGDIFIIGVEGEVYPCDRAVFEKTYEPVAEVSHIGPVMLDIDRYVNGDSNPVYLMETDEWLSFEEVVNRANEYRSA